MPDNKQPIEYYVAEAKRLGLSEEQQSVIGDETDGESFREHMANAHDQSDDELREILAQEWENYSADHSGESADTSFDPDAEAEDEADGRHADSDNFDDEDDDWDEEPDDEVDEEDLDDEDDDFGSDVGEDDEDIGEEPEEDFDASTDALDHLEIDEEALEQKRNGGGEALDDGEADCEGCKI